VCEGGKVARLQGRERTGVLPCQTAEPHGAFEGIKVTRFYATHSGPPLPCGRRAGYRSRKKCPTVLPCQERYDRRPTFPFTSHCGFRRRLNLDLGRAGRPAKDVGRFKS